MTNKGRSKRIIATLLSVAFILSLTMISVPSSINAVGSVVDETTLTDGIYQIRNAQTGQYMTATGGSVSPGMHLTQNTNSYVSYQQFLVKSVGNGEYTIQPMHADGIAVSTPSAGGGTLVKLATLNSSDNSQRFTITKKDSNNYYSIKSKISDFANAFMILNASTTTGEPIYQYAYDSGKLWHHWYFEFVGPESGVYYLRESGTTSYLTANAYSIGKEDSIPNVAPKNDDRRKMLFKIVYCPERQNYVIKSMIDNSILIYAKLSNNVPAVVDNSHTTDSAVPIEYTWEMTRAGANSCYIWAQSSTGTKYYLTLPANGVPTLVDNQNSATKWEFDEYETLLQGIEYIYNDTSRKRPSHILSPGDSLDLSFFNYSYNHYRYYSSFIGDNAPGAITYSVSDISGSPTSIATITSSGMLNTVSGKAGVVKVTASFESGASFSSNYYVQPTTGEYFFIQNSLSNINIGYVDGNNSGATKNNFTYDDTQLWQRIPSAWSGYYYIKNVGTGLYLSSPFVVSGGTALEMVSGISNELQAWEFLSTPSGSWKIRCRYDARTERNFYMNIVNGVVVQDTYAQDSNYDDEFNIIMIGDDVVYHRTLEGFVEIDPSKTVKGLSKYYDTFNLMHPVIHFGMESPTYKEIALDYLQNAKIVIFNGHGSAEVISLSDRPQKYLYNKDIFDPTNPSSVLNGVDIVIFAGCSTGGNLCQGDPNHEDYCCPTYDNDGNIHNCNKLGCSCCATSYNMPKVAIGWHVLQRGNHMNDWIDRFISYMCTIDSTTGKLYTAQAALIEANNDTSIGDVNTAILFGTDPNFRLDDSANSK